jgi:P27 family predicted phage terminase small subunit
MKPGPRPQSKQTRELTGQAAVHPERVNKLEPTPPPGAPDKPTHLDQIGSEAWDHVVALFAEMGMLNKADGVLIEIYASCYSSYRSALAMVAKTGQVLLVREEDGKRVEVKRNPYSVELHKYRDALCRMLAEMGMTPSGRSRVAANPKEETDPFSEWLKAKRGSTN